MQAEPLFAIFDSFEQPVFLVRKGRISCLNPAAQRSGFLPDAAIEEWLLPGQSLSCTEDALQSVQIALAGGCADATVRQMEDGYLFILQRVSQKQTLDALSGTIETMRRRLTSLFSVSDALFSVLEEDEDPEVRRYSASLNRIQYQFMNLVLNLDDYSHILNGTLQLSRQPTDLTAFLNELYDLLKYPCSATGRKLRICAPAKPVKAWIHPLYFKRMLMCLVDNAIKFSEKDSEITVSYEKFSDYAIFSVTDSGEGMTAEVLAGSFHRFEERGVIPDPRWGVGLGLPIARTIAQLHEGTLVLQTTPGHGTTAAVRIPLHPGKKKPPVQMPELAPAALSTYPLELVMFSDVLPPEVFDIRGTL